MIKAILFDVDGTLLDTHEYIYQAFEYSLGKHHKPLSRKEIQKIMGKPIEDCYRILTKLEDVELLSNTHRKFQTENPHISKPFANTISTLDLLKDKNIKIAAITTRAKSSTKRTLELANVWSYLDFFIGFEDVKIPKPDPERIFKALEFLNSNSNSSLMVGDSDVDILAGQNAGVKTAGAIYGFHGNKLADFKPDFLIDDIGEIIPLIQNEE